MTPEDRAPHTVRQALTVLKPHLSRRNRGLLMGLVIGVLLCGGGAYIGGPNAITGNGVEWLNVLLVILGVGGGLGVWWRCLTIYARKAPASAVEIVRRWSRAGRPEAQPHPLQSLVDQLAGRAGVDEAELTLMQDAADQAAALSEERAVLVGQLTTTPELSPSFDPIIAEIDVQLAELEKTIAALYAESRAEAPTSTDTIERLKATTEVARTRAHSRASQKN